ncbi:MAG TPA: glycogen debranching enzyme N-terminal domain-containing protein, partial [Gemmatimonadales bacterium]|nr:glycogen debranching enzyme N-terminal domain-containing protein [Gemmatimonadales bacterium]
MADSRGISASARGIRRVARATPPQLPMYRLSPEERRDLHALIEHEWLVTNGIGGYSSSSVAGIVTRRYHGLLVAALANPLGRTVMLNTLLDSVEDTSGRRLLLSLEPRMAAPLRQPTLPAAMLTEFRLDGGIPVWRYALDTTSIEKRVWMPYRQNTVIVLYRVDGTAPVTLHLTPAVHSRNHEAAVSDTTYEHYSFAHDGNDLRITTSGLPPLQLTVEGQVQFIEDPQRHEQIGYPVEETRGYGFHGSLWSPGTFVLPVAPGES